MSFPLGQKLRKQTMLFGFRLHLEIRLETCTNACLSNGPKR